LKVATKSDFLNFKFCEEWVFAKGTYYNDRIHHRQKGTFVSGTVLVSDDLEKKLPFSIDIQIFSTAPTIVAL